MVRCRCRHLVDWGDVRTCPCYISCPVALDCGPCVGWQPCSSCDVWLSYTLLDENMRSQTNGAEPNKDENTA
eukprot:4486757-Amphidinium_carterae.1